MDPLLFGLIGTVFGGAGLKTVEAILNRGKNKDDTAAQLRTELRQDLATIKADLKEEAKSADDWQRKYWELKHELLIVNHKTNEAIKVVDDHHKEDGLGERLEGLENPGK